MLKLLLYIMSLFYGMLVSIRNQMYDLKILKSTEFDMPVISVGNITVGGTGKTPHIEYLTELMEKEIKIAVLSRGYKRKTKGFREVTIESTVEESGDEPLQIKRKFPNVGVFVDEKRVHGIEEIIRLSGEEQPDAILLDDAFQHRSVTPGINILLVDYNRPITEDRMLPAGQLREKKVQMRRASMIIFTKCPSEVTPITRRITMKNVALRPYQDLYFTTMEYGALQAVFPQEAIEITEEDQNYLPTVLMVSGIAQPKHFYKFLSKHAKHVEALQFPDHHNFSEKDLQQIEDKFNKLLVDKKFIITTEKDAMRFRCMDNLSENIQKYLFYIPVKPKFLDSEGRSFDKKILNYVRENKSNRKLHKRKNQRTS